MYPPRPFIEGGDNLIDVTRFNLGKKDRCVVLSLRRNGTVHFLSPGRDLHKKRMCVVVTATFNGLRLLFSDESALLNSASKHVIYNPVQLQQIRLMQHTSNLS